MISTSLVSFLSSSLFLSFFSSIYIYMEEERAWKKRSRREMTAEMYLSWHINWNRCYSLISWHWYLINVRTCVLLLVGYWQIPTHPPQSLACCLLWPGLFPFPQVVVHTPLQSYLKTTPAFALYEKDHFGCLKTK